jgi:hypothetical protein
MNLELIGELFCFSDSDVMMAQNGHPGRQSSLAIISRKFTGEEHISSPNEHPVYLYWCRLEEGITSRSC